MPPRRLLAELSAPELTEYELLYGIDAPGDERLELSLAALHATLRNYVRPKGAPAVTLHDVLPFAERPRQTPEQQRALCRQIAAQYAAACAARNRQVAAE